MFGFWILDLMLPYPLMIAPQIEEISCGTIHNG